LSIHQRNIGRRLDDGICRSVAYDFSEFCGLPYLRRGIAVRPLAGAPTIVMAYLLRRNASLSDTQARFARRARLVS